MCPRTLDETDEVSKLDDTSDLTKAKVSYVKPVVEESVKRKMEMVQRQSEFNFKFLAELLSQMLTLSTVYYKLLLDSLGNHYTAWTRSKIYRILFHTTQPAHVITIAAVLCVTSALYPSLSSGRSAHSTKNEQSNSKIVSFVYLTSFVVHFGAQIWMTFVSGLSLYFALPRHAFAEVQRVLFPRYFTINACLSLTTLIIFVKRHPADTWDSEIAIQILGMLMAFFLELLIRLYLTPPLLKLIVLKNSLEKAAGVGNEVGRHSPGPLRHCPHYVNIHNAFRRTHVYIAMGNMTTMACTVLHLYYIASKLC